jgi:2'-5' RNA ligase
MMRCFIAVELDEPLRVAIAEVQRRVRAAVDKSVGRDVKVQWIRPESIHVTVKFLGEVPEGRIPAITNALRDVATSGRAGTVEVGGLGVFPDLRNPRVCWIGLREGAASLIQLAEAVEAAMDGLGFPMESRPYSPHLTLARMKEGGRAIGRVIEQQGLLTKESGTIGCLTVRTLTLMKSELRPSGAVYTRLAEVALKDEP